MSAASSSTGGGAVLHVDAAPVVPLPGALANTGVLEIQSSSSDDEPSPKRPPKKVVTQSDIEAAQRDLERLQRKLDRRELKRRA